MNYEYMHKLLSLEGKNAIITGGSQDSGGAKQLREQGIKYFFCEKGILRLATDGNSWTVERLQ